MAKMFYKLEEAAAKLGMTEHEVMELANSNTLQRFLDRDTVMFKVKDVDALAANSGTGMGETAGDTAIDAGDSDGPIPLADSGDTDAIQLMDDEPEAASPKEDTRQATGVSVFDADEIDMADPMAQTQVTGHVADDEDLALESVGSGSGLLDLTRESDDTSLGAELLDEIYPGEGSDAKMGDSAGATATGATGSSGVFDNAMAMQSGASGLENITDTGVTSAPVMMTSSSSADEPDDPVWSNAMTGVLLGAVAALVIGIIAVPAAFSGTPVQLSTMVAEKALITVGILAGVTLVLAVIFGVIGKMTAK